MHHIGQDDYNAGFVAGQRLVREGIKEGYCLNHAWGNSAVDDRCRYVYHLFLKLVLHHRHAHFIIIINISARTCTSTSGFSDALLKYREVHYRGMVKVEPDSVAKYTLEVEKAVRELSPSANDSWDNIGILSLGASQARAVLHLKSLHRNVTVGSFDMADTLFEALADGDMLFGIDQQPFIQGSLPVYLLTYGKAFMLFFFFFF